MNLDVAPSSGFNYGSRSARRICATITSFPRVDVKRSTIVQPKSERSLTTTESVSMLVVSQSLPSRPNQPLNLTRHLAILFNSTLCVYYYNSYNS